MTRNTYAFIVISTYNEAGNLDRLIGDILAQYLDFATLVWIFHHNGYQAINVTTSLTMIGRMFDIH